MIATAPSSEFDNRVIVIGAGIAGLATAARLAHAGKEVLVFEQHDAPGGKMRTIPSPAGPVDAGPTVLTMRPVFEKLFTDLGERLEDHVTLVRQRIIARHFWKDGSILDLHDTRENNIEAIRAFAGAREANNFRRFDTHARTLFEAFEAPVMQSPTPSLSKLVAYVARHPRLLPKLSPFATLDSLLRGFFDDPRLIQLFGRYATYVGGSPYHAPALLALIWRAESAGVWSVDGGMHQLAVAIERLALARGAVFHYGTPVAKINVERGSAQGVTLDDGSTLRAASVVFNGDPRALTQGLMGSGCTTLACQTSKTQRSLSAEVWAFAACPSGPDLAHHNVFFRDDPQPEFNALARGQKVDDPTIYVCAIDRGQSTSPPDIERFETIANAPPLTTEPPEEEITQCRTRTFQTLTGFGLRFDRTPGAESLTTPAGFNRMFPASTGSLYGQSPHGMTAALQRPQARTKIGNLFLAGGGA
uniref:1-hydroxycarotenoid 3,4-desaturase CrtD n=1 Tax=unclassified Roseovarius TaxID=2614913 RepID=UPI00273EF592